MTPNLTFAEPTEWWLEISPEIETQCWQESLVLAPSHQFQTVYLNQLCLGVFLPWLQAEYNVDGYVDGHVDGHPDLSAPQKMWEMVSGVGLTLPTKRLALIPTEDIDLDELAIPQEWIDIPGWTADYYLAIQVNREEQWMRVWGYADHQQVKQTGRYDTADRTYCLEGSTLGRDLNAFWVTYQLCPEVVTQAAVAPLPALSNAEADSLIQQLSAIAQPRLAVPFGLWGALLAQPEWLDRLLQQRHRVRPTPVPMNTGSVNAGLVNLGQWFQNVFEDSWQSFEALLGTHDRALRPSFRSPATLGGAEVRRVKPVQLATPLGPQGVILLMELSTEADGRIGVRIQIHPTQPDRHVPSGLALIIYSETGQMLQAVYARVQDDYIQLPHFRCGSGTRFRLQVSLGAHSFSEHFMV